MQTVVLLVVVSSLECESSVAREEGVSRSRIRISLFQGGPKTVNRGAKGPLGLEDLGCCVCAWTLGGHGLVAEVVVGASRSSPPRSRLPFLSQQGSGHESGSLLKMVLTRGSSSKVLARYG